MVADQLVGLMPELYLGELRKPLELARSNRSSVWLAVRLVFERIAEEIGQTPEFARAFLSSLRQFNPFDFWQSSPENSATYGTTGLERALPLPAVRASKC
jgi:hypothetical protein